MKRKYLIFNTKHRYILYNFKKNLFQIMFLLTYSLISILIAVYVYLNHKSSFKKVGLILLVFLVVIALWVFVISKR